MCWKIVRLSIADNFIQHLDWCMVTRFIIHGSTP
jgi:hypothetical protein